MRWKPAVLAIYTREDTDDFALPGDLQRDPQAGFPFQSRLLWSVPKEIVSPAFTSMDFQITVEELQEEPDVR